MTAPPDYNAVKRKIRTVLNDVTSETPETHGFLYNSTAIIPYETGYYNKNDVPK